MPNEVVAFRFAGHRIAHLALRRIAGAVEQGFIAVDGTATVRARCHGRHRVRHGLPRTPAQQAEWTLLSLGPLYGVAVDVPDALGPRLGVQVPDEITKPIAAGLVRGQIAVVLLLGEVAPLVLAELVRPTSPALVATTFDEPQESLLRSALAPAPRVPTPTEKDR